MEINIDREILDWILKNEDVADNLKEQKDNLNLVNDVQEFIKDKKTLSVDDIKFVVEKNKIRSDNIYFVLQLFVSMATDISIEFCNALCDAFNDKLNYDEKNNIKFQFYISGYYKKSNEKIESEIRELSAKKDFVLVKYLMFIYGQNAKDKSELRFLFGRNYGNPNQIFFAKTFGLIDNNQPKSIDIIKDLKDLGFVLRILEPLMSEIDFDGCVYWNLNNPYFDYICDMTNILQKFNTNELMSIDLNTLTYQQQFILFKTLQHKDSGYYIEPSEIRNSLAGYYKNSGWIDCTWKFQQYENKKLAEYLLKFITRDDVRPETKLLLAVYFSINYREYRKPRFGWEDEMQIVTKNFADLSSLLDAVLTVYSKIKDGKKLKKEVLEFIDNIIRCYEIEKITEEIIKQDDKDKLFLLLQAFKNYNFQTSLVDSDEDKHYNIIKKAELACKILLDKKNLTGDYKSFLLGYIKEYIRLYVKNRSRYCVDYHYYFRYESLEQIRNFIGIDLLIIKNPDVSIEIKKKIYEDAKQALDEDKKVWDTILDMYITNPNSRSDAGYYPEKHNGTSLNQLRSDSASILTEIKKLEISKASLNKQYENNKPKLNWLWFTVIGTVYYICKLIYLSIRFRINKNKLESAIAINEREKSALIVKLKQAEDKQKVWRQFRGDNGEKSEVYRDHEEYLSLLLSLIDTYEALINVSQDKKQTEVKNNLAEPLKPKLESEKENVIQPVDPNNSN